MNASSAAREAGYSEKTAGQIGHALLKNVEIKAAIGSRLTALGMDSAEATARLSAQARGELPTKVTRNGESFVEVFNMLRALETMARIRGLYRDDRVDEPLIVRLVHGNGGASSERQIRASGDASGMHD